MSTLKSLAQEAINVQDASNLCGLAQRFAEVCVDLMRSGPLGTNEVNEHPIVTLWLSKMCSLNGMDTGYGTKYLDEQWRKVEALAKGE